MSKLCWTQVLLSWVVVVATMAEVETIIWSCPAMAGLGLLIAILSTGRDSIGLLAFGLLSPCVTSLIALLIATFDIGPATASKFVWALLALNAIATLAWWVVLSRQIKSRCCEPGESTTMPFRYSILNMLTGMTLAGLVFASIRLFIGAGEMTLFAAYGIAVLLASAAILLWSTKGFSTWSWTQLFQIRE